MEPYENEQSTSSGRTTVQDVLHMEYTSARDAPGEHARTRRSLSECTELEGWSKEDKFKLLECLKYFGSYEVDKIQKAMPHKTLEQINFALEYYKKKAMKHPIITERKRKEKIDVNSIPRLPIASWAKFLTDALSFENLQTETATALRLIAELENIPIPLCTDTINFRNMYHMLANAMEGKALPKDKYLAMVLDKCILETALLSKAFVRNSTLKYILENVDLTDNDMNVFPKPTHNLELSTISHLASQRNYNPLNIPEEYLKPSMS